ncbi:MAG: DUF4835 family protein [Bacteroidales bacterium]|nr:DUF4835 family protein [Bacteroidales bacterium]
MKRIIFLILISLPVFAFSQELLCRVSVNYSQVTTTNTQIFQALQRDVSEFMNNTHWTNYVFNNNERIECSMLINVTEFDGVDNFTATLQVSSTRPVFDASLTTSVINIKEGNGLFKFQYIENQPIEYNENTFTSELAYTLAFYAQIVIGMDFDTFSEYGGTEFFETAQKIVTNAQASANRSAWTAIGASREDNRYYLAKFLTSPVYKPYRQAMYKYHRLGLDMMTSDINSGRQNVTQAIDNVKQIYQKKPGNFLVSIFLETKRTEIINIFSEAPPQEIARIQQTMKLIDVTHASDYDKIGQGN